jgi:hypothetical protein
MGCNARKINKQQQTLTALLRKKIVSWLKVVFLKHRDISLPVTAKMQDLALLLKKKTPNIRQNGRSSNKKRTLSMTVLDSRNRHALHVLHLGDYFLAYIYSSKQRNHENGVIVNAGILVLWDMILVKAHQRKMIGLILRSGRTVKISTLLLQTLWSLTCTNGEWRQKQKLSYFSWSLEKWCRITLLVPIQLCTFESPKHYISAELENAKKKSCCFANCDC